MVIFIQCYGVYTMIWKTAPYHNTTATKSFLIVFAVNWGLYSLLDGLWTKDLAPFPPKRITFYSSVYYTFLHFSLGQYAWAFANDSRFCNMLREKERPFSGTTRLRLLSRSLWGIVSTLIGTSNSFFSFLVGINGLFLVIRTKCFSIKGNKIHFLSRDSTFGLFPKAFIVILLEQSSMISEYDFSANDNFFISSSFSGMQTMRTNNGNFLIILLGKNIRSLREHKICNRFYTKKKIIVWGLSFILRVLAFLRLYVLRTFWHTSVICVVYINLKDSSRPKQMELNREHFRQIIFYNVWHGLIQQ